MKCPCDYLSTPTMGRILCIIFGVKFLENFYFVWGLLFIVAMIIMFIGDHIKYEKTGQL